MYADMGGNYRGRNSFVKGGMSQAKRVAVNTGEKKSDFCQ